MRKIPASLVVAGQERESASSPDDRPSIQNRLVLSSDGLPGQARQRQPTISEIDQSDPVGDQSWFSLPSISTVTLVRDSS
jgi:hypothetical protein